MVGGEICPLHTHLDPKNTNKSSTLILAQLPSGSFVMLNTPVEQCM